MDSDGFHIFLSIRFSRATVSSLSGSQICESPSSSPANHRIAPPSVHFWAAGCRSTIGEPGTYRFCHHNYHTRTTTYSILYFNLTQFMFSQTDPTFVQQTILYHRASKFLGHHSCPHRPLNFMLGRQPLHRLESDE